MAFVVPIPTTYIELLSLNVNQFPSIIPASKHNKARSDLLIGKINESKFDVIAFQELWSDKTRTHIYNNIKCLYPFKVEDNQHRGVGLGSGLAIYSKYPIKRTLQHTYKNHRSFEDFSLKGLMGVELNVSGKSVYLLNTHLQDGDGFNIYPFLDVNKPDIHRIPILQLQEAKLAINEFITDKTTPAFLVGDFNIAADSDDYKNMMNVFEDAIDTFDIKKSIRNFSVWNEKDTRIDYVLAIGKGSNGYSIITDYFGSNVTDHLGVIGTFNISCWLAR